MKRHPVTVHGRPDRRYSIQKEFCGYAGARWVVRFCDEWIGQSPFYASAVMMAVGHNSKRLGALVITEIPA